MSGGKAVLTGVRLLLGITLAAGGVLKAGNAFELAEAIANYRLVPAVCANAGAIVLPWVEICTGVLLIAGLWKRASAGLAALLFGIFTTAVGAALARGLDISCGCFGSASAVAVGLPTLGMDAGGLAAAAILLWKSAEGSVHP